ncbi:hypothetical protein [uncultured Bacteroides sp.]|uniref:hypothetical protein n=1 Tax=uncultured Bacteroides sp. TaxID=162156 RepID=UPI0025EFE6FC|nr:hypothetical protein [uncultured Bacteroides sp.]
MKQKLLADIELDVHELKCLMESFSKEPNRTSSELLKRSITRMQGRLDEFSQEIGSVVVNNDLASSVVEETVVKETMVVETVVEDTTMKEIVVPFIEPAIPEEDPVVLKKEEPKSTILGESIKLAAGLRRSISLNDSFRFSRELFKGDTELMNRVIEQISVMGAYETAVAFLASKTEIDEENEAVVDFLELLKKYFNQPA